MFEGIVSDLLVKHLGKYIKNLDPSKLSLGIWGGDVVLKDLEIVPDALKELKLPVSIRHGFLGKLVLKVPWKSLRSKPVIVEISDVELVVGPQDFTKFEYNEEAALAAEIKAKMEALDQAESLKKMREEAANASPEDKGFAAKLVTSIVGNLQVRVTSVHVRFEDVSPSGTTYALGFSLDSLLVQSTDSEWQVKFIDPAEAPIMHKLVELNAAALYLDSNVEQYSAWQDPVAVRRAMHDGIARAKPSAAADLSRTNSQAVVVRGAAKHEFLIQPMRAVLHAKINDNAADLSVPKIQLSAVVPRINVDFERQQYLNMLCVAETMSQYAVSIKNLKWRPKNSRPTDDPRAWWRYAIQAVRHQVHDKVRRRSWKFILEFRKLRDQYIALYKRTQGRPWHKVLTKDEQARLTALEEKLDYEDTLLFRSYATAELAAESTKAHAVEAQEAEARKKKSFFTRWTSSNKRPTEADVHVSDKERAALYADIGVDDALSAFELPREYVKMTAEARFDGLQLTLRRQNSPLMVAAVSNMTLDVKQRPDSMLVNAALGSLSVEDLWPVKGKLDKAAHQTFGKYIVRVAAKRTATDEEIIPVTNKQKQPPLLALMFEQMPLDNHADSVVHLRMQPLDIVVSKPFLDRLGAFVEPEVAVDLSSYAERAKQTVESVREGTKLRLEAAIDEHKVMDVDIQIAAPYVFVPDGRGSALILDFGRLSVTSDLHDEQPDKRDENDYYDKFDVVVSEVKVLLAPLNAKWWREEVQSKGRMRLVDDVAVELKIYKCIDPSEVSLPKMKVTGQLPRLAVHLSPSRYTALLRVVAALSGEPEEGGRVKAASKIKSARPPPPPPPKPPRLTIEAPDGTKRRIVGTNEDGNEVDDEGRVRKRKTKRKKVRRKKKSSSDDENDNNDDDDDEHHTAMINKRDEETARNAKRVLATRVELTAAFSVGEVSVDVAREGEGDGGDEIDHRLVCARISGLALQFTQLTYGAHADVTLRELAVDDLMQTGGAAFAQLIRTHNNVSLSDASRPPIDTPFIQIKYVATKPEHPDYNGEDSQVDVELSALFVHVNRDTISQLIRFGLIDLQAAAKRAEEEPEKKKNNDDDDDDDNDSLQVPGARRRRRSGSVVLAEGVVSSLVSSLRTASPALASSIENALAMDARSLALRRKEPVRTTMRATVRMSALGVMLNGNRNGVWRHEAEFKLSGVDVLATMRSNETMTVEAKLQNIALIDKVALANDAPYAEILTPVLGDGDAAMLEVGFDTYSEQLMPHHLYPGWQSAARVRLASSRFVLLNAFVDHMRAYFVDGPIMSALLAATAEQARARAAQAARAVAADPVPASRMKLDLKLSSFFVEIPETSSSENKILVDCGEVIVSNSFREADKKVKDSSAVEVMKVCVQNVNIVNRRVLGGNDLSSAMRVERFQILRDFDVVVDVTRVLSPECRSLPMVAINMDVSKVNFFLSESQYRAVMATLAGNFAETAEPPQRQIDPDDDIDPDQQQQLDDEAMLAAQIAEQAKQVEEEQEGIVEAVVDGAQEPPEAAAQPAAEADEPAVWRKLALVVRLEQVALTLLHGEGLVAPAPGEQDNDAQIVTDRALPNGLAVLSFDTMALHVTMMTDGAIDLNANLAVIRLNDVRPNSQNQFKTLFGRGDAVSRPDSDTDGDDNSDDGSHELQQPKFKRVAEQSVTMRSLDSQIAVQFERNAAGDSVATVDVRQLRAYVVPSLLYELQTFFASMAPPPAQTNAAAAPDDTFESDNKGNASSSSSSSSKDNKQSVDKKASVAQRTPTMLAVVKIEMPQLFLLEDETNKETRAVEALIGLITINYAVDEKARQAATVLIDDMEIFTCQPLVPATKPVPIIRQFDTKLDYVKWRAHPDDVLETQTVGVEIDPVVLLFSYQDAMLLSSVSASLVPPAKEGDEDKGKEEVEKVEETDEEAAAKLAFRQFDADGSGGISKREFRRCLRVLERPATRAEADALFKHIDADNSGEIDEQEFVEWYLADGVAFLGMTTSESDVENDGPRRPHVDALPPPARLSERIDDDDDDDADDNETTDERALRLAKKDTRKFEQAVIKCWSVTLTLINDFQGRAQPFAELRLMEVDVEAKGWSSPRLQAALGMTLTMDFFNPRVMMFEPVIEYWTLKAGLLSGGGGHVDDPLANNESNQNSKKRLKEKKKRGNNDDDNDDNDQQVATKDDNRHAPRQAIAIHSEQRLNVNVSHAMIDTMLTAYAHVQDDAAQWKKIKAQAEKNRLKKGLITNNTDDDDDNDKNDDNAESKHASAVLFAPYWLENGTGDTLWYAATTDLQRGRGGPAKRRRKALSIGEQQAMEWRSLAAGEHAAISFGAVNAKLDSLGTHSLQLRVQKDGGQCDAVPMDTVGVYSRAHPQTALVAATQVLPDLVVTVAEQDGSKHIVARSHVTLRNDTDVPLHIEFAPHRTDADDALVSPVALRLPPSDSVPVPLAAVRAGVMRARPVVDNDSFQLCDDADAFHLRSLERQLDKTLSLRCQSKLNNSGDSGAAGFNAAFLRLHVSRHSKSTSDASHSLRQLTFSAPLCVHNSLPRDIAFQLHTTKHTSDDNDDDNNDNDNQSFPPARIVAKPNTTVCFYNHAPDQSAPYTIEFDGYQSQKTLCSLNITDQSKQDLLMKHPTKAALELQISCGVNERGLLMMRVFAPFALHDRTSLLLEFAQKGHSSDTVIDKKSALRGVPPYDDNVLFSFPHSTLFDAKLVMRKAGEQSWSSGVEIDALGTSGCVAVPGEERYANVRVTVGLGAEALADTKVVTLTYQYVLVNELDSDVYVRAASKSDGNAVDSSVDKGVLVPAGARAAWHWPKGEAQLVRCRRAESEQWSGAFPLDNVDEFVLEWQRDAAALANKDDADDDVDKHRYAAVTVDDSGWSMVTRFAPLGETTLPFAVDNDTDSPLRCYQINCRQSNFVVAPRSKANFTWREPAGNHTLVVETPRTNDFLAVLRDNDNGNGVPQKSYALDAIKAFKPMKVGPKIKGHRKRAFTFVRADGPTRVLCLTHNAHKLRRCVDLNKVEDESGIRLARNNEIVEREVALNFAGVGLSLVNERPIELMYLTMDGIVSTIQNTSLAQKIELKLGRFQIDNQLYSTPFPVMLAKNLAHKRSREKPTLHLALVKSNAYHDIDYYNYASLLLQELDVAIDDAFLFTLLEFAQSLPLDKLPSAPEKKDNDDVDDDNDNDDAAQHDNAGEAYLADDEALGLTVAAAQSHRKVYFEILHLNPVKLNVTFEMNRGIGAFVSNPVVRTLGDTFITTVGNLDAAPLRFNALLIESAFGSMATLQARITAHYTQQGVREAYKLLGSAEVLGNPVGLFNSLSTGVTDFFYEPAEGIVESPAAFGRGLATGTISLLKNTIAGTFNTASKLTSAMGKGVAVLSLDDKYIAERNKRSRYKPKHAADGLFEGGKDLARGVFDGITGIVVKPVEGAIEGGVLGFGKGVAQGLIGAAVKPVGGVLSFASKTTAGIKNTATLFDAKAVRIRLARPFAQKKILEPYDVAEAEGFALLYLLNNSQFNEETYNFHRALGKDVLLVSDKAIYDVKTKQNSIAASPAGAAPPPSTDGWLGAAGVVVSPSVTARWRASFTAIEAVELAVDGVLLRVSEHDATPVVRHIQCRDTATTLLLFTKLSACVKAFHEEHAREIAAFAAKREKLGRARAAVAAEEGDDNDGGVRRRAAGGLKAQLVQPRPKREWIPDQSTSNCQICKSKFTVTHRRHHCRLCCRVVCGDCSAHRARTISGDKARVCVECFENVGDLAKVK